MSRKHRNKEQIVKAIFRVLHKEKKLCLTGFRRIGLNNPRALEYFSLINTVAQEINQCDLIEVITTGKITSVRFTNGFPRATTENTDIIQTESNMTKIVQAIEFHISKLAFALQTGERARKKVTPEKLKEAEKINEGYQNYLSQKENSKFSTLVKQKEKNELSAVFAELKKSKAKKGEVEGES